MGLLTVAIVATFGLTITAVGYFLFGAALLVIIWIDLHHKIIPDSISRPGIVIGFLFSFFNPTLSWQDSLIGLLVGGGLFYAIAYSYFLVRKKMGLGGGDIKLLAMIGAFLGWQSLPFVIFASSLTGTIIGITGMIVHKNSMAYRIPFGPFLSLSALCYLFFSSEILHLFGLYIHGELF